MLNDNERQEFLNKLKDIASADRVRTDEPMTQHTTFRIGGPADFFFVPASTGEVAAALALAAKFGVPVTVLGNGSNVLVLDKGIRGLVIKFDEHMGYIRHTGAHIYAGAGASLGDVSRYAACQGLTGMEFAVGIPGSVGGAVFMNAGAYDGEMGQVVCAVIAVCPDGTLKRFTNADIDFGYRHSVFQENKCVICEVELALKVGSTAEISRKMDEYTNRREAKQPVEMPSAGSTFKRPPGYYAGTLIEQTGLKGLRIGGAQVSDKHAGFIINAGGATAQDVLALIREVQRRVHEKFNVQLQPEVRIIGEE
ncbi:UDP-N-acetylmuramate dehydrogenase [Sporolituus thermophilus]|uniref:UDP-N-acetylmuramate dehydrogenase n=1 Tax=Sporolituus thermophilus TaxID=608505 RepID=UPI000ADE9260